ncbi:hypothetical protein PMAYCL1PPCAC_14976 [Pristionchus mayeri]|uniref:glutathione transferase n=1 Tax=Pristionchus mayeri TaxID=1317129 RepID=A0AAN5CI11_9BILA|nr:hypothetical protein PMAYCL1PPCAC_14976 [Pristionchus mayeri]
MPSYKFSYFDARGRGEVGRQLFHLAGVPFEDHRISQTEWPALKEKTLFHQLPLLEVNGQLLTQSYAIFRYLAKQFGMQINLLCPDPLPPLSFDGNSPFEAAWVDALADQHKDYFNEILPALVVVAGLKPGDKDQLMKDVAIPARDKYFALLEQQATDNGNNGHFVGSTLTWVDLLIADHVDFLIKKMPGFLDYYPHVLKNVHKIESIPKLREYLDKRPDTAF